MSPPSTVLDITQTGSTVSGSASSSASPEDISPDLSRMQLKDPVKFQGDAGKSFNVTSNYLKIVATPNTGVYEYDVRFNPNVDSRQDRFRLIRQIEPTIGTIRVSHCFLIKFIRLCKLEWAVYIPIKAAASVKWLFFEVQSFNLTLRHKSRLKNVFLAWILRGRLLFNGARTVVHDSFSM